MWMSKRKNSSTAGSSGRQEVPRQLLAGLGREDGRRAVGRMVDDERHRARLDGPADVRPFADGEADVLDGGDLVVGLLPLEEDGRDVPAADRHPQVPLAAEADQPVELGLDVALARDLD